MRLANLMRIIALLFGHVRNTSGIGLVETVIVIGIMGVIMAGVVSLGTVMMRMQGQSNLTFQADASRRAIVTALNGAASWKQTVMDPQNNRVNGPALDCIATIAPGPIQPGGSCTTTGAALGPGSPAITNQPIRRVLDASGGIVHDATQPTMGLSAQGARCNTFPSETCPLRFTVLWSALCSAGSCVNPQPQLQIVAQYDPGGAANRIAFNPANYGTQPFIQGSASAGDTCWTYAAGQLIQATTCPGFVGIGTTTPNAPMHAAGGGDNDFAGRFVQTNAVRSNGVRITTQTTNATDSALHVDSNGGVNPILVVRNNGNVGIGTSTPSMLLHSFGSTPAGHVGSRIQNNDATGYSTIWLGGANDGVMRGGAGSGAWTGALAMLTSGASPVVFATSATERMRIDAFGNIGIGTTSPIGKLSIVSVNGSSGLNAGALGRSVEIGTWSGVATVTGYNPLTTTHNDLHVRATDHPSVRAGIYLRTNGGIGVGTASVIGYPLEIELENGSNTRAVFNFNPGISEGTLGMYNSGVSSYQNFGLVGSTVSIRNMSDLRLKKDVENLTPEFGLAGILKLRPVTFRWRDAKQDSLLGRRTGLIAQELEDVFPQLVSTGSANAITLEHGKKETIAAVKMANYEGLIVPIVAALKEFHALWSHDRERLSRLETELSSLKNDNQRLKSYLCAKEPRAPLCD